MPGTAQTNGSTMDATMPIAIIGAGCRFPGDARSPEAFWELLSKGRSALTEIPKERFNIDAYFHPNPERRGTVSVSGGLN